MPKVESPIEFHPVASVSLLPPERPAKPKAFSISEPQATNKRPAEPLSQRALGILAGLPSSFQMHETRKHFPHVMNKLAEAWFDPEFFHHAVRNLLIDQRGGRAGFPFSVLAEITNLREYYYTSVKPEARAKYDREI